MAGHGCPLRLLQFSRVIIAVLIIAIAPSCCLGTIVQGAPTSIHSIENGSDASTPSNSNHVRLRFSWGGGDAQTWTGKITAQDGSFSKLSPLGLTPDASSAVRLIQNELLIGHWSPTNYGGVDVQLDGTQDTEVTIMLTAEENPDLRFERTFSFDELISETVAGKIDLADNRCSVSRVPGDRIDVAIERDHLVFSPGEGFSFSLRPNLSGLTSKSATCRVRVAPADDSGIRFSRYYSKTLTFALDDYGSSLAQEISLAVPDEEGVYNVEIEIEPIWYQASLVSKKTVVKRDIQFIVLSKQPPVREDSKPWREIAVIDSAGRTEEPFPGWSQFSRLANRPVREVIGNNLRSTVVVGNQTMMQLQPGGWQAIPLTMDGLGKPNIIELEYVTNEEMALGISLLQPDDSGQIPLYGFDSGVFVPKSIVKNQLKGRSRVHRLTVWPTTKTPYLLVANRHGSLPATIGKVRVIAGPDHLAASELAKSPRGNRRGMMAFYEAPLFPENFGAREQVDPSMSESLDDWRMFHEGAGRLIEYLKANSYRGAFITVACDGSSVYPSQRLLPTPKHDNGVFFSTGQDPVRKDILEMLFRMFERENLTLVPTLALSGPLPEIESKRDPVGITDVDMVDLNQARRKSMVGGNLPIYNPLSPVVQQAVLRVIDEVAHRYQSFESFNGLAVVCRPDTMTLLPGRQWGYDSATVQRFIQSQPDLQSLPLQWREVQQILLGSHRTQWIQWRADQMTRWYQEMAGTLHTALPTGKLYIAPVDLYRNDEFASALSPSLHTTSNFEDLMHNMGFSKPILEGAVEGSGGIVFLNPHRLAPDQTLASQRADLAVENSEQAHQMFSNNGFAGDLFTHRISWAHFEQLQAQSPFGKQDSPLMRLQQMTPAEQFNRQRFVESIKTRDSRLLVDGGWMMSMGEEVAIHDLIQVFSQLPDVPFQDVYPEGRQPSVALPLAVRQYRGHTGHYFYVANASPWSIQVQLEVETRQSGTPLIESLGQPTFQINRVAPNPISKVSDSNADRTKRYTVSFVIPPYGLIGGRTISSDLNVANYEFEMPENADKDLRKRVYLLQSKLIKSTNVKPLNVINNSGFEVNGSPSLAGWDIGEQGAGNVRLATESVESESPISGASLVMSNSENRPVWIRSNTFPAPETGRLSISVWLKTSDPSAQPPLRLAVESQTDGTNYYRFGSVGGLSADDNSNQLEARWKRFAVHFDDLPIGDQKDLRIGFDLMGPGVVSIDRVEVYDRWLDENDAKVITQMLASTGPLLSSPSSFDSCRQLLEGYWPRFLNQYIGEKQEEPLQNVERASSPTRHVAEGLIHSKNRKTDGSKKVPMFRRFRGFGPKRKTPLP